MTQKNTQLNSINTTKAQTGLDMAKLHWCEEVPLPLCQTSHNNEQQKKTVHLLTGESRRIVVTGDLMFFRSHTFTMRSSLPDTRLSPPAKTAVVTGLMNTPKIIRAFETGYRGIFRVCWTPEKSNRWYIISVCRHIVLLAEMWAEITTWQLQKISRFIDKTFPLATKARYWSNNAYFVKKRQL